MALTLKLRVVATSPNEDGLTTRIMGELLNNADARVGTAIFSADNADVTEPDGFGMDAEVTVLVAPRIVP